MVSYENILYLQCLFSHVETLTLAQAHITSVWKAPYWTINTLSTKLTPTNIFYHSSPHLPHLSSLPPRTHGAHTNKHTRTHIHTLPPWLLIRLSLWVCFINAAGEAELTHSLTHWNARLTCKARVTNIYTAMLTHPVIHALRPMVRQPANDWHTCVRWLHASLTYTWAATHMFTHSHTELNWQLEVSACLRGEIQTSAVV